MVSDDDAAQATAMDMYARLREETHEPFLAMCQEYTEIQQEPLGDALTNQILKYVMHLYKPAK